jgi:hypothetical protein
MYLKHDGQGPLQVPRFGGIPLDFELPLETRFAHGLVEHRHLPRLSKWEIAMLRLMQHITETTEWMTNNLPSGTRTQWKAPKGS